VFAFATFGHFVQTEGVNVLKVIPRSMPRRRQKNTALAQKMIFNF
jgi:hypothetical protein